jgi:predicted Zn-dependent protease
MTPERTTALPRPWAPSVVVAGVLLGVLALLGWAIARRQDNQPAMVALAREYVDRGDLDQALRLLSALRKEQPDAAKGLTLAAQALLGKGAVSSARRALETSLLHDPDQADACKMLAAIYLSSGDGQRGIALLKRATELDRSDFRPWFAMGKVHHDLGQLGEAEECFAQALRRSPSGPEAREARLGRIRALLDAKQADRAGIELDEVRATTPDDPDVLALAARQALASGRLDDAHARAEQALAGDPSSFDALLTRARIHFSQRQPELARHDLDRALAIRAHDVGALQLMAQVQWILGLAKESESMQRRAERSRQRIQLMDRLTHEIAQSPNDPRPRWQMGQAAIEGETYSLAYECFRAALDLDPNFQPARDGLRTLRIEKGYDPASGAGASAPRIQGTLTGAER